MRKAGHFVNILSLRTQSWNIAQYPEIANQTKCAILGGSRVAYIYIYRKKYLNCLLCERLQHYPQSYFTLNFTDLWEVVAQIYGWNAASLNLYWGHPAQG